MGLLDVLDRHFGRFAVRHVLLVVIAFQVVLYILGAVRPGLFDAALLIPDRVRDGEWYRLFSFVFLPPGRGVSRIEPIFAFFYWYLLFLFGSALEGRWGTFRFNLFLLIGYAATVAAAFVQPMGHVPVSNGFLYGTLFLAFAYLYPDFTMYLFFILPVRIKWLALLAWVSYGFHFVTGDALTRASVVASVLNFLLFFGSEIWWRMRGAHRSMRSAVQEELDEADPQHCCSVCGETEQTRPDLEFRYDGPTCYCTEHLPPRR